MTQISSDKIDRMEGLSKTFHLEMFKTILPQLTRNWIEEGFEKEDVMEYLEYIMDKETKVK